MFLRAPIIFLMALSVCASLSAQSRFATGFHEARVATLETETIGHESSSKALPLNSLYLDVRPALEEGRFQWGPAIQQSMRQLAVQHAFMFASDRWTRHNTVRGSFFNDWKNAIAGVRQWDDGDPFLDNYVGHPMQGAVSGYIQVQNDPRYRNVQFGLTRDYWKSRLRAMGWIALTSTQFEIGPLSEASLGNLGSYEYQNCLSCRVTNGTGYVDLVVTPAGGAAWMTVEDALDRFIVGRAERNRSPRSKLVKFLRFALNPARGSANLLALRAPWHRARDERTEQKQLEILLSDAKIQHDLGLPAHPKK